MGSTDMDLDYRLLFDLAPDPCLVLDRQFRMVAANRARLEATMTTLAELLGRSVFDLFPDNPQEAGATGVRNLRASLQRVLKTGMRDVMAVQRYDIPKPLAEGGGFEERYWSPINVPVPGTDGEVAYIIHRVQDVTEFVLAYGEERRPQVMEELRHRSVQMEAESYNSARETADINFRLKQANDQLELKNLELRELNRKLAREAEARVEAQEALHAANAELDRSNKNLELFASVASHDLQEPLHTITSYTELLGRRYGDRFDDRGRQYMSFILDGTHHMHRMINDLLAYSRVNTRARPFFSVDLNAALKQALTSLARGLDESKATIEQVELPQVEGDDLQLAQLFQNLLSNAVKFAKKDVPLVIRISCEGSGSEWLLGVHDNGIGIEPRFLNQIFEIFRRLHTRQEYEGTGIGLAICKRIVEHHGGRIWAESTFGEGASFFFTLPTRGTNHGQ